MRMGLILVHIESRAVVVGNIGWQHHLWQLLAFGNGMVVRRASGATRCRVHGATLSTCRRPCSCYGLCLVVVSLVTAAGFWQRNGDASCKNVDIF